jgi:hypothetical protein
MSTSVSYKGRYIDSHGSVPIELHNDFSQLSCVIDDVRFSGDEFTSLRYYMSHGYTDEQLSRFSFYNEPNEMLCDCTFIIEVPQILIDLGSRNEIPVIADVTYVVGKARSHDTGGIASEAVTMTIPLDGTVYKGYGDSFEAAMHMLHTQWEGRYIFKNCFGCAFSDYSPAGNSSFGTMMCFLAQKDKYLAIDSKDAFLEELTDDYEIVQEIFWCKYFEIRRKGAGYRG